MGPAFSLLLAVVGIGALAACIFCIFRLAHSTRGAIVLAIAFTGGAVLAFPLAVLAAMFVVGVGQALKSSFAVGLYLAWLGGVSLAGGLAAARWAARVQRGNEAPKATAQLRR
jgi:hypothetical protein